MKSQIFPTIVVTLMLGAVSLSGCQTSGQSGALAGAGIGALAGQAIGGSTQATLIGAAVGTGIGYIIGNEQDKKHAETMSRGRENLDYTHNETGPLGGTWWNLVSLSPRDIAPPYVSKTLQFRSDGRLITTTTKPGGDLEVFDESYRVVGDTLIINKPGYLINARYQISDNQLIVSAESFSAVLQRLPG